jgi:HSP20 family molecular chaperone IbpA
LTLSQFSRTFRLPDGVTENDIKADMVDGVLNVVVNKPKQQPAKRSKITVQ